MLNCSIHQYKDKSRLSVGHIANLITVACIDSWLSLCNRFGLKLTGVCIYKFLRAVIDPPEHIISHFAIFQS